MAYEDIRREESSRDRKPKQEASRPPPHRAKPRQNERPKQKARPNAGGGSQARTGSDWKPGPGKSQADIDRCLRILELDTGGTYTQKQIKKAYRKLAMVHHPDLPTGNHEAFVKLGMASDYLMKWMGA